MVFSLPIYSNMCLVWFRSYISLHFRFLYYAPIAYFIIPPWPFSLCLSLRVFTMPQPIFILMPHAIFFTLCSLFSSLCVSFFSFFFFFTLSPDFFIRPMPPVFPSHQDNILLLGFVTGKEYTICSLGSGSIIFIARNYTEMWVGLTIDFHTHLIRSTGSPS